MLHSGGSWAEDFDLTLEAWLEAGLSARFGAWGFEIGSQYWVWVFFEWQGRCIGGPL